MENSADERAILLAKYIIENSATVRCTAKVNCVSKSTVHSDVTKRLKKINGELYEQVRAVLEKNKKERHIRGGLATKEKWEKDRQKNPLC